MNFQINRFNMRHSRQLMTSVVLSISFLSSTGWSKVMPYKASFLKSKQETHQVSPAIDRQTQWTKYIKAQFEDSLQFLKNNDTTYWKKRGPVTQLMNLCKSIGQAQVMLLNINLQNLELNQKKIVTPAFDLAMSDLNKACDGSSKLNDEYLLKKATVLSLRAQNRLTHIYNYLDLSSRTLIQAQSLSEAP